MSFNGSTQFSWGMMAAALVSMPLIAAPGHTAESIIVRYKSEEATVSRQDLDAFTDSGDIPPALQELLGADVQVPGVVRSLLKEEIKIPKFVERFIEGSNGDFLLLKLDEAISSASGSTEQDLQDIRTAVMDSIADNRVSFIELIGKHPQANIQVDLTNLEGTYKDVRGFVERVLPAIEVAKGVLQDLVCDCEQKAASTSAVPSLNTKAGPMSVAEQQKCDTPNTIEASLSTDKSEREAQVKGK